MTRSRASCSGWGGPLREGADFDVRYLTAARRVPLMPEFAPKVRFASDSPLEEAVRSEPVSERVSKITRDSRG